jgi:hypothetical protein
VLFKNFFYGHLGRSLLSGMPSLTTNPIPGFFGEYCAVIPKTIPANLIAVGINPGQAWANVKIALALESSQMQNGYQIIRISEEEYQAAVVPIRS